MSSRRVGVSAVAALVFAMISGIAGADVTPSEAAAARSLFDEARALMQEGKNAQACPKLEESQRLDPGMGTLFNLADCNERVGKTASAWSMYLQVASQAKASKQADKEQLARQRASALEPKLSRLVITVPAQSDIAGLLVTRDGAAIGRGSWGSGIAVDPGEHIVEASAPGHATWQTRVSVLKPGAIETATVPLLQTSQSEPPAGSAPPALVAPGSPSTPISSLTPGPNTDTSADQSSHWGAMRIAGLSAVGLGAAGLIVGTAFGLKRNSKQDEAKSQCLAYPNGCTDAGQSANRDAASAGKVAVAGFVVGGVLAAAGVVLLLIPPTKASSPAGASRVQIAPMADVRSGGLVLQGIW